MFCPNCGSEIKDGAKFCVGCGKPVGNNSGATLNDRPGQYSQPNQYQQNPYNQYQYAQPVQPAQPALGMKWFKFVINFSLWAGALLNIGNAIMFFTGMHYDGEADAVYEMFEELKTIDLVYGVAMIALGVYLIVTRFRLAGYYKNGPAMFISTYAIALALSIGYVIATAIVCGDTIGDTIIEESFSSMSSTFAVNIAMIIYNIGYFNKRKHMFIN